MHTPRISASSYSNTAPLIWSFLYGSQHGRVELILDNAPARSAELLSDGRVDAALVPVIAYHSIKDAYLVPNVCVGAKEKVRSVCIATRGKELADVSSVALDTSSRTSAVLAKIIFREFLGFEPEWRPAEPNLEAMLQENDAALLIGDPALGIADRGSRIAESSTAELLILKSDADQSVSGSAARNPRSAIKKFDLAEIWRWHTGFGFIFAMWMTRSDNTAIGFAAARDEGISRFDEIAANYLPKVGISEEEFREYLSKDISYTVDEELRQGMELYLDLARKLGLIENVRELKYAG